MIKIKLPATLVRWLHLANGSVLRENVGRGYHMSMTVEKYESERAVLLGMPYDIFHGAKNILTPAGRQMIWKCLTGQAGAVDFYSAANSSIFVGDSSLASPQAAGQPFNLFGANVVGVPVDPSSPTIVMGADGQTATLSYRSTFGTQVANFTWSEAGLCNANTIGGQPDLTTLPGAGTLLNRYVPVSGQIGVKTSGLVWVAQMDLELGPTGD